MFKEGQKIKMKEDCIFVEKGDICELRWGDRLGGYKDKLFAWGKDGVCYNKRHWQLRSIEDVQIGDLITDGTFFRRVLDVGKIYVIVTAGWKKGEKERIDVRVCFTLQELKEQGWTIVDETETQEIKIGDEIGVQISARSPLAIALKDKYEAQKQLEEVINIIRNQTSEQQAMKLLKINGYKIIKE